MFIAKNKTKTDNVMWNLRLIWVEALKTTELADDRNAEHKSEYWIWVWTFNEYAVPLDNPTCV